MFLSLIVTASDAGFSRAPPQAVHGHLAHVALVLLARPIALGALSATVEPRDDTFVRRRVLAGAAVPVLVLDLEVALDAVQHDLLLLRGERAVRRIEIELVDLGDRFEHAREVLRVGRAPWSDRATVDRLIGVRDDQLRIDLERGAETVARLARAVRRVEREVAWRRLVVARAALRAGQVLAEGERLAVDAVGLHQLDLGNAVGQLQRRLERVGEPTLDAIAPHETIDDDFDLVLLVPRQSLVALQELGDVDDLAVDSRADVTLAGEVFEERVVVALAPAHDRRQHLEAGAVGQQQDAVDDLLRRLPLQAGAVVGAVLDADARRTADAGSRRSR